MIKIQKKSFNLSGLIHKNKCNLKEIISIYICNRYAHLIKISVSQAYCDII